MLFGEMDEWMVDGWMKEMRLYGKGPEWDGMGAIFFFEMQHNGTEQNEKVANTSVAPPVPC